MLHEPLHVLLFPILLYDLCSSHRSLSFPHPPSLSDCLPQTLVGIKGRFLVIGLDPAHHELIMILYLHTEYFTVTESGEDPLGPEDDCISRSLYVTFSNPLLQHPISDCPLVPAVLRTVRSSKDLAEGSPAAQDAILKPKRPLQHYSIYLPLLITSESVLALSFHLLQCTPYARSKRS